MRHICGVCRMCMTYLGGMPHASLVWMWRLIVRVSRGVHGRAELGVLPARYHLIVRHTLEVVEAGGAAGGSVVRITISWTVLFRVT